VPFCHPDADETSGARKITPKKIIVDVAVTDIAEILPLIFSIGFHV